MLIELKKYGTLLLSRQNGREAFAAFQPQLTALSESENLELDFEGVITLSPSWADEFLSPLLDLMGDRLVLLPSDNLSVHATLRILQEANKSVFRMKL
ncbi:MAG: hypothetical protein Q8R55_02775 [Candidatus Taylorbacteria bacterium]|nr:hypothetical protein [Candidatus Taylorbacteria bacterium]